MNSDPASPKKMRAGLKLYGKKPSAEPAKAMTTSATTGFPCNTEIAKMKMLEIAATPDSNPSSPSIKLIAFIMPTYHSSVTGMPTHNGNSIQFELGSCTNGLVTPGMTKP